MDKNILKRIFMHVYISLTFDMKQNIQQEMCYVLMYYAELCSVASGRTRNSNENTTPSVISSPPKFPQVLL